MPLGFLTELHGVWHICTGIGAYIGIAIIELLTWNVAETQAVAKGASVFAWPVSPSLQSAQEAMRKAK